LHFGVVRVGGVDERFVFGAEEFSEEKLAIYEVFCASEVDEGDEVRHSYWEG
jgi:hypothetical protein